MTPAHPEYMIATFGVVMVGLSLVTVCIDVIREKIELMYMALLKKMLQVGLSSSGNHHTKEFLFLPLEHSAPHRERSSCDASPSAMGGISVFCSLFSDVLAILGNSFRFSGKMAQKIDQKIEIELRTKQCHRNPIKRIQKEPYNHELHWKIVFLENIILHMAFLELLV